VKKNRDRYLALSRVVRPALSNFVSRLNIKQDKVEDPAVLNIKTITVTFHVNEDTGNIVNATQYGGSPGKSGVP
jgi:hypothetical protein